MQGNLHKFFRQLKEYQRTKDWKGKKYSQKPYRKLIRQIAREIIDTDGKMPSNPPFPKRWSRARRKENTCL